MTGNIKRALPARVPLHRPEGERQRKPATNSRLTATSRKTTVTSRRMAKDVVRDHGPIGLEAHSSKPGLVRRRLVKLAQRE